VTLPEVVLTILLESDVITESDVIPEIDVIPDDVNFVAVVSDGFLDETDDVITGAEVLVGCHDDLVDDISEFFAICVDVVSMGIIFVVERLALIFGEFLLVALDNLSWDDEDDGGLVTGVFFGEEFVMREGVELVSSFMFVAAAAAAAVVVAIVVVAAAVVVATVVAAAAAVVAIVVAATAVVVATVVAAAAVVVAVVVAAVVAVVVVFIVSGGVVAVFTVVDIFPFMPEAFVSLDCFFVLLFPCFFDVPLSREPGDLSPDDDFSPGETTELDVIIVWLRVTELGFGLVEVFL
jgi:hypothetical protein